MTSRRLLRRVETLERHLPVNRRVPKRCMPEWLQDSFEADGWVFDARGQIISVPEMPIVCMLSTARTSSPIEVHSLWRGES